MSKSANCQGQIEIRHAESEASRTPQLPCNPAHWYCSPRHLAAPDRNRFAPQRSKSRERSCNRTKSGQTIAFGSNIWVFGKMKDPTKRSRQAPRPGPPRWDDNSPRIHPTSSRCKPCTLEGFWAGGLVASRGAWGDPTCATCG